MVLEGERERERERERDREREGIVFSANLKAKRQVISSIKRIT